MSISYVILLATFVSHRFCLFQAVEIRSFDPLCAQAPCDCLLGIDYDYDYD